MFTGIIRQLGSLAAIEPLAGGGSRIAISVSADWPIVELGESVAINGVCSTVIRQETGQFWVDYMPESLAKTTVGDWASGLEVHLELPATPNSMLGGHVVSGHVDTVGTISAISREADFARLQVQFSQEFAPYLIPKGSITIDGMSLTVGEVTDTQFSVYLIPHTLTQTNLKTVEVGRRVNLEFDQVGKYLYRFFQLQK